jgi:hypothetical protein
MARGKHAAQAARQRAEAASDALGELKRKYEAERAEWKTERAALLSEVQRLTGRLLSDVAELAQAKVKAAREDAEDAVREAAADFERKAIKVLTLINTHPDVGGVAPVVLDGFAEVLGVWGSPAYIEALARQGVPRDKKIAARAAMAKTEHELEGIKRSAVQSWSANRSRWVDPR